MKQRFLDVYFSCGITDSYTELIKPFELSALAFRKMMNGHAVKRDEARAVLGALSTVSGQEWNLNTVAVVLEK